MNPVDINYKIIKYSTWTAYKLTLVGDIYFNILLEEEAK